MHSVQTEAEVFHPAKEIDTGSPVFDLGHLQRYTLGDQDLQSEVLGLFREQIASSLVVLRESIVSDDSAAWRMAAHTLKGSAWAVGAFLLAEAAELAERDNATRESRSEGTERIARAAVMTVAAIS
jgi:HPt (histidine-containing phosphotransfer) domain-containing protein